MSGRSVNLTTLLLGRLRPPKRLTSTSCTYFRQHLTTALLESAEGQTKVCGQTGYPTQDLRLKSQVPYRLRYAARLYVLKLFCYVINHTCIMYTHWRRKRGPQIILEGGGGGGGWGNIPFSPPNNPPTLYFYVYVKQ